MNLSSAELERLERISQRYPKRYFDSFRVQRQFFAAKLDDGFFQTWFSNLTNQGTDLKTNFSRNSASCTWLLLLHQDCPDWLRDLYKNFPKVEGRRAALLGGSGAYQLTNIDLVLTDRSRTIKEEFFYRLDQMIVRSNDVGSSVVLKALEFVKNSNSRHLNLRRRLWRTNPIVSFFKEFQTASNEGVAGLVNPNSKIRSKSEYLFKQPPEIQEKIRLILKEEL